jgi:catechol 2,3-dioxygenase-like lactoylglutathione lyase family enzyme
VAAGRDNGEHPVLGRLLEVSVHAPDILESLAFYERLGFTQAQVGETWSHPYAVVTDGRLFIGLHQYEFPSPSLTYVQPDLMQHLDRLEQLGIELAFRRVGTDVFNEAGFTDPNGQMVALLEARTYSPPDRPGHRTSRLGWFEEFALPARDLQASAGFWEKLGFVPIDESDDPFPRVSMTSDTLNLTLARTGSLETPALVFAEADMAGRIRQLREGGVGFSRNLPRMMDPEGNALLQAPEGTLLLLTTSD